MHDANGRILEIHALSFEITINDLKLQHMIYENKKTIREGGAKDTLKRRTSLPTLHLSSFHRKDAFPGGAVRR